MAELARHGASRLDEGSGDAVDEASIESFPASDAPAWWAGTTSPTDDTAPTRAGGGSGREQKRPPRR